MSNVNLPPVNDFGIKRITNEQIQSVERNSDLADNLGKKILQGMDKTSSALAMVIETNRKNSDAVFDLLR